MVVGNNMAVSPKVKNKLPCDSCSHICGCTLKRTEGKVLKRYWCTHAQQQCYPQKPKGGWVDKQSMVYPYNGIFSALNRKEILTHAPTSMKLEDIMWSEITEEQSVSHSVVSNSFANTWTVAYHTPLSMGFFRQEYWSCHSLLQGIFPTQWSDLGLPQCRQNLYWESLPFLIHSTVQLSLVLPDLNQWFVYFQSDTFSILNSLLLSFIW